MKATTALRFGLLVVAATAQSNGDLPSLAQAVQNLSPCSLSSFSAAVKSAGCESSGVNADTFNCMCNLHLGSIVSDVARSTDGSCIDFSQTFGTVCGVYLTEQSSSDVSAGVSALQGVLNGNGGSNGSSSASASASASATATSGGSSSTAPAATTDAASSGTSPSASATAASTTSSKAAAAAPTMMALGGVLGPAAAIAALLL